MINAVCQTVTAILAYGWAYGYMSMPVPMSFPSDKDTCLVSQLSRISYKKCSCFYAELRIRRIWGNGGIVPRTLNLDTRSKGTPSFACWLPYSQKLSPITDWIEECTDLYMYIFTQIWVLFVPLQAIIQKHTIVFPPCSWHTSIQFLITYVITQLLCTANSVTLIQSRYVLLLQILPKIIRSEQQKNRKQV